MTVLGGSISKVCTGDAGPLGKLNGNEERGPQGYRIRSPKCECVICSCFPITPPFPLLQATGSTWGARTERKVRERRVIITKTVLFDLCLVHLPPPRLFRLDLLGNRVSSGTSRAKKDVLFFLSRSLGTVGFARAHRVTTAATAGASPTALFRPSLSISVCRCSGGRRRRRRTHPQPLTRGQSWPLSWRCGGHFDFLFLLGLLLLGILRESGSREELWHMFHLLLPCCGFGNWSSRVWRCDAGTF